jgi:hypothetical protein
MGLFRPFFAQKVLFRKATLGQYDVVIIISTIVKSYDRHRSQLSEEKIERI